MIKISKKKKGFTLIEILVVVLIIGVISAIAYPIYNKVVLKSRAVEAINLLEMVRNKQLAAVARNGEYIQSFANMGQLTVSGPNKIDAGTGNMMVGNYNLVLNPQKDCMSAQYIPKGTKGGAPVFSFSASYENTGLGCDGSICASFGNIVGSAGDVCKCAGVFCQGGYKLNHDTCQCQCQEILCNGNFTFNKGSCNCECKSGGKCPAGMDFNVKTCQCEKKNCNIVCKGNQVKDDATCTCKCPLGQCLNGGICVDPDSTCIAGQTKQKSCPGGNGTITVMCQNSCPNKWVDEACKCDSGYKWDGSKCAKQICADGSIQKRSCAQDYTKVQTRTFTLAGGWGPWEGCCDCGIPIRPDM